MRQLFRIAWLRTALPGIIALCWLVSSVQAQTIPPVLPTRVTTPATGPAPTGFRTQQIVDSLQRLTKPGYYSALLKARQQPNALYKARLAADLCNTYLCTTTSPALSISLTNNGPLTCTRPLVALTVTGAPASSTYAFGTGVSQPGGPTSSTATVATAGLFSVTVTAPTGATATAQTTVTSTASLTATISGALTVCAGNTTSLTASGGESFRWSTGATTATISATTGTYSVTAITGSCQATATASVSLCTPANTPPVATTNVSQTATVGRTFSYTVNAFTDAETPTSLTYSASISPANGLTFDPATRVISGTPDQTGVVSVTVTATDVGGLSASTSFSISVQPRIVGNTPLSLTLTASPTTLLTTGTVSLWASVAGGKGPYTYVFSGPGVINQSTTSNVASVSAIPAGVQTFTVVVRDAQTPTSQSASATVSVTVTVPAPSNTAPTVASAISPQSATVGVGYTLSVANTFTDAQTPNSLSLSVSGLPQGLSFTAPSTISGTPSVSGVSSVTVTATDPGSLSASTVFSITVSPAPVVVTPLVLTLTASPTAILTTGSTTLSATVSGGKGPYSYSFSGPGVFAQSTPNVVSVSGLSAGVQTFTVVVRDAQTPTSQSASATVSVTVTVPAPSNTAPTVASAISPQSATVGVGYTLSVANTFTDAQTPNSLSLSVSGLPQGLSFTAPSTISGTPSVSGVSSVTVTATDPGSLSASTVFSITVSPAPVVVTPLSLTLTASPTAILTTGSTTLSATVSGGKSPYSYSFSGPGVFAQSTPNVVSVSGLSAGVQTFTVVVRDAQTPTSQSASATVSVTVTVPAPSNTAPTVANAIGPQSATVGVGYTLSVANTFTDAQTPTNLTLTATSLPAGLSLTGTTISGTPSTTMGSPVSVTLTATDPGGPSASTVFTITVAPASMSVTPTAPFAITGVTTVSCATLSAGQRSVSFTPQYAGLNGSAVSFSVVNELAATTSPGPYALRLYTDNPVITLRAVQSGAVSNYAYNWLSACNGSNPTPGNTAPTVANAVGPQSATVGIGFTLSVSNTFTDAQTPNSLVLSAAGLPAGLSLTGTTISGAPSTTVGSPYSVTLTATDPSNLSASTVFTITVAPASTSVTPTPTGPFAITGVTTVSCATLSAGQRSVSFTPQYAGMTGQPISFSVANELAATTSPGPYTLRLYTDNPTITLKAVQSGVLSSYAYNWLAACNGPQPGNTAPTVASAIPPQSATVGQGFSYVIPAGTFTDAQTPNSLSLSVSGLPQGLSFTAPATISGIPSVSGVSSVTVTATDPGNLSVSTSFSITVSPASSGTTTAPFAITGVTTVSCTPMGNQFSLSFNPRYAGLTGQPISFSVANELATTTAPGPYTLRLYADNPTITLKATQNGTVGQASFSYNWLAACQSGGRLGGESEAKLDVVVLGNPITGSGVRVEVRGAQGQSLRLHLSDLQGRTVTERVIEQAGSMERVTLDLGNKSAGMLLLRVSTPTQSQTVKVIKAD